MVFKLYFAMFPIGYQITRLRQNRGWTQEKLASHSGIRQANLSKIERGLQDLTVTTLLRICSSLEIPPAAFFEERRPEKSFLWTRSVLERVARAALGSARGLKKEEKEIVELLKNVVPGFSRRLSSKQAYQSWFELRQKLSDQEIRSLLERVQDARQRIGYEKSTHP